MRARQINDKAKQRFVRCRDENVKRLDVCTRDERKHQPLEHLFVAAVDLRVAIYPNLTSLPPYSLHAYSLHARVLPRFIDELHEHASAFRPTIFFRMRHASALEVFA